MLRLNYKKSKIKNTPVHRLLHVAVNNINGNAICNWNGGCFALFLNPIVPGCQSARRHFTPHLNTKHICTSLHQMHERFQMHFWLFFLSSLAAAGSSEVSRTEERGEKYRQEVATLHIHFVCYDPLGFRAKIHIWADEIWSDEDIF